jgi:hypothetical protein
LMTSSPYGHVPFGPVQNLRLFSALELSWTCAKPNPPDKAQALATFPVSSVSRFVI